MQLQNLRKDEILLIVEVLNTAGSERLAEKIMDQFNKMVVDCKLGGLGKYIEYRDEGSSGNMCL